MFYEDSWRHFFGGEAMQRSPLKHVRLQQLKDAGLNTVDFLWYPPGKLNEQEVADFFERHRRVSFRQFKEDGRVGNLREIFDVRNLDPLLSFIKANRHADSYAIVNQGVDLKANTIRGCFRWFDLYAFGIEFFIGQGNPRRIEKKKDSELIQIYGDIESGFEHSRCRNWDGAYSGLLKELGQMTSSFLTGFRPIIIEFEWHTSQLGWKPDNWLFWEWRIEHLPEHKYSERLAKFFSEPA